MSGEDLKDTYDRYEKLIDRLKWTNDAEEIKSIKHEINNLLMIINFYKETSDGN